MSNYQNAITSLLGILALPEKTGMLDSSIQKSFRDIADQEKAATIIKTFCQYFMMFQTQTALMKVVYEVIDSTFEIIDNLQDLEDLLVKSITLRIIEIFIDYSKLEGDKDKVIKTLSTSLDILAPAPLIINLGMLVKPVFNDPEFVAQMATQEVEVVAVIDNSEIAQEIKGGVDRWINMQSLNLDSQDELLSFVEAEVIKLGSEKGFDLASSEFSNLLLECKEMVNLKLAAMSFLMGFDDEDLSPQPLSL